MFRKCTSFCGFECVKVKLWVCFVFFAHFTSVKCSLYFSCVCCVYTEFLCEIFKPQGSMWPHMLVQGYDETINLKDHCSHYFVLWRCDQSPLIMKVPGVILVLWSLGVFTPDEPIASNSLNLRKK